MSEDSRARLVDQAIELFGREGLGDRSLRTIADRLGTSHRMLHYHFGSRAGLVAAVAAAVEARQRAVMLATNTTDRDPAGAAAAYWEDTVEATLRYGPLFFEIAADAAQGRPHAAAFGADMVAAWLPAVTELCQSIGIPEADSQVHARLALAATRGLLLDLLVTGERTEVTEAAALLDAMLRAAAAPPS